MASMASVQLRMSSTEPAHEWETTSQLSSAMEMSTASTPSRAILGKGLVFQMVSKTVSTARLEGCVQKEEFLGTKTVESERESRRMEMCWMRRGCVEASTIAEEEKSHPWRSARRETGRARAYTRWRTAVRWTEEWEEVWASTRAWSASLKVREAAENDVAR